MVLLLVVFSHIHFEFRIPELFSVAKLEGVDIRLEETKNQDPKVCVRVLIELECKSKSSSIETGRSDFKLQKKQNKTQTRIHSFTSISRHTKARQK